MKHEKQITLDQSLLLVIDLQDAFTPHIAGYSQIIQRTRIAIEGMRLLNIPIMVTEQYPKGLGHTVTELRQTLKGVPVFEKTVFSAFSHEPLAQTVQQSGRRQILLAGVEAHVCLLKLPWKRLRWDFSR